MIFCSRTIMIPGEDYECNNCLRRQAPLRIWGALRGFKFVTQSHLKYFQGNVVGFIGTLNSLLNQRIHTILFYSGHCPLMTRFLLHHLGLFRRIHMLNYKISTHPSNNKRVRRIKSIGPFTLWKGTYISDVEGHYSTDPNSSSRSVFSSLHTKL